MSTQRSLRDREIARWTAILGDENLARRQVGDETRRRISRAIVQGATQREIAHALGVSAQRVSQIVEKISRPSRRRSPLEEYFAEPIWEHPELIWRQADPTKKLRRQAAVFCGVFSLDRPLP